MIVGIDPGQSNAAAMLANWQAPIRRKIGQYEYEIPPIVGIDAWQMAMPDSADPYIWLVTEGQWLKGKATKNKDAILSLAIDTGIMLGRICTRYNVPGYVLPVGTWKTLVLQAAHTDKFVHANQIAKLLTANEVCMLPKGPRKLDALSAIGIAFAAYLLGDRLEGYRRC